MAFSPTDTSAYIQETSAELRKLAEAAGLETLSYLLGMTEMEAEQIYVESKSGDGVRVTKIREGYRPPTGLPLAIS